MYTIKKVKRQPAEWDKIFTNHRNLYSEYGGEKHSYNSTRKS